MAKMSRRSAVKNIVGAAAATVAAGTTAALASETGEEKKTEGEAAPDPRAITVSDIAASDKIAGRDQNGTGTSTEAEKKQMVATLTRTRKGLEALRASPLADGMAPAAHFDARVPGVPYPMGGKSKVTVSRASLPHYNGDVETLAFMSATDLGRLLHAQKVTSTELTQMYLRRLKKFGPRLLCVVSLCEEIALSQAARADSEIERGKIRGPLHGVPYAVKDLLAARGTRTTFGAKPYEDQRWDYDSTVVARLEDAGCVLMGKLSMGELAMDDVWFGGKTRNPWKPDTGSSGSSAGSGSATAAGLVGFSIGTETLGSIVSPCVRCGTTGLRPTFGRVSRHGAMPLSWTMDKIGPMTRSVEDAALVFAAIHGPDGHDLTVHSGIPFLWEPASKLSKLRVGVDQAVLDELEKSKDDGPGTRTQARRDALATLDKLGVKPVPVHLPPNNPAYDAIAGLTINAEGAASFAQLTQSGGLRELARQEDWNWPNALRAGATIPAAEYVQALRIRAHLQREMAQVVKDVDVYVTFPFVGSSLTYTNLTGHPTVVTRCGMVKEKEDVPLPVMVEFTGNLFREDAALRLAYAYERATDWHKHWPDTESLPTAPPPLEK